MEISFLGGAGTVTGSKTLIESNGFRMLVDCGLFQGLKQLRDLNWHELAVPAASIELVLLTHGHLDHCGWLPRLVSQGFTGKIYCTAPTKAIAKLVMLDSAKIQEEEAQNANEKHYSKHEVAKPLYTIAEAERVLPLFRIIEPGEKIELGHGITATYSLAGHILGAATIAIDLEGKTLVFSGDVGQTVDPLMFAPEKPKEADYIFLESTYGNRLHPDNDHMLELETYINNTVAKGGTTIIPGFAVERAQTMMYLLYKLRMADRIPDIPYFLDTPMGISVLDIFTQNMRWHRLSRETVTNMCEMFILISDFKDTFEAMEIDAPKVVIAASGMLTGGRVLSWLERYVGRNETTLILVGYQAEGTRGRKLLEGATEIKMFGRYFPVKANVLMIDGLSAHADQSELLGWLSELKQKPKHVYLNHGENLAADELRVKIQELGIECSVPLLNEKIVL